MKIMRVLGLAMTGQMFDEDKPQWLKSYDVEAHGGRGDAVLTGDRDQALRFEGFPEAMTAWRTVSKKKPKRADGKPNRPLTGFHVEIEDA